MSADALPLTPSTAFIIMETDDASDAFVEACCLGFGVCRVHRAEEVIHFVGNTLRE